MIQLKCWLTALQLEEMGLTYDDRKRHFARLIFVDRASVIAFIKEHEDDFVILYVSDWPGTVTMSVEEWLIRS